MRRKAELDPVWRSRYLAAPGGMHLPAALLDATRLISHDPREDTGFGPPEANGVEATPLPAPMSTPTPQTSGDSAPPV